MRLGPVIRLGDAVLDLDRGTLNVNGEPAAIRNKTFLLLRFMASNPNRVIGKDELLDAVWPDVTVTEDSLTQCVSEARRILGDEGQRIIRTIARRGYILTLDDAASSESSTNPPANIRIPTVVVLPFRVDPRLGIGIEGDVLAEDVSGGIACFRTVAAVATSSAARGGPRRDASALEIGRMLGADFCVDASLRSRNGCEVTLGLTDVHSGYRDWSRRFTLAENDINELPDAIATLVASHVVSSVEHSIADRERMRPAGNGLAYAHLIRGRTLLRSYGKGVNEAAREEFRAAVSLDANSGLAKAYLALSEVMLAGYQTAPLEVLEQARDDAQKAMMLSPLDARCHRIFSTILTFLREFAAAEAAYRKAYELNTFDPDTMAHIGFCCAMRGRPDEALDWLARAIRLNPFHPDWYHLHCHIALFLLGRYGEAAKAIERIPLRSAWHNARLSAAYALDGRLAEAGAALRVAYAASPDFDVDVFASQMNLERLEDREHYRRGLRLARDAAATSAAGQPQTDDRGKQGDPAMQEGH